MNLNWMKNLRIALPVLALVLAGWLALAAQPGAAREHQAQAVQAGSIVVTELPAEARTTLQLIKQGGPYPYPRDGVVFGNHERRLPQQARGYYHEYTVKTPGARNRGARRIVCGRAAECYYSDDHYQTFKRIRE
ncbi:MAG TPA: ribonuclease [Gallionellaceae bacterium]|nr:ribonuclease [Gallionellaceae bacterium]